MFRKILLPTRFEEFSLQILQSIVCLKTAGLEEVVLLHVIDSEALHIEAEQGIPLNQDWLRHIAAERFDPYCEYLGALGIKASIEIKRGRVVTEIIRTAVERAVSLIVAGRQRRKSAGDLYAGHVTNGVIRKASAPVLVMKYHTIDETDGRIFDRYNTQLFEKILYPTDWSIHAKRAKEFLPYLHRAGASEHVFVHVIEEYIDCADGPAISRDAGEEQVVDMAMDGIKGWAGELDSSDFKTKGYLFLGKPYREIMRIATEENASLIVMGSQGRGFDKDVLWGSVSQRIVEYSEKPVLVVK